MFANFCAQSLKLSRAEVWSERIDRSGRLRLEYSAEILKEILEEILEEVVEETGFKSYYRLCLLLFHFCPQTDNLKCGNSEDARWTNRTEGLMIVCQKAI